MRLKVLHRQDRTSLFKWMTFVKKHALHFATRRNSKDIQKCNCFWVPSSDLFASATKAVFPMPTATGDHTLRNRWLSLLLSWQLVHNYGDNSADNHFLTKSQSATVPFQKKFFKKFKDPPLIALCLGDLGKLCQIHSRIELPMSSLN